MDTDSALRELSEFAKSTDIPGLKVHQTAMALDERQDGEPVLRALLLVDDPGEATWELDSVVELRQSLARRATELELPSISISLVPKSEAEGVESFAS